MTDRVDFEARQARIAQIKQQIAAGTYETPERLEAAVEVLLRDHLAGELATEQVRLRKRPK